MRQENILLFAFFSAVQMIAFIGYRAATKTAAGAPIFDLSALSIANPLLIIAIVAWIGAIVPFPRPLLEEKGRLRPLPALVVIRSALGEAPTLVGFVATTQPGPGPATLLAVGWLLSTT